MGRAQLKIKPSAGKTTPESFAAAGSPPEPAVVSRAVNVRNFPLNFIALLAALFTLQWARQVLIPLVLALFISYVLDPLVTWMEARKIPRTIGAAMVLLLLVAATGSMFYSLGRQGDAILEQLPEAAQKLRQSLHDNQGDPDGTLSKVQKAATELEKTAAEATNGGQPKQPAKVQAAKPALNLHDYLWVGTVGVFGAALQALMILFLVYFLLVSGDVFRRKLVKIAGPSLAKKRITVEILDEVNMQIKRFLLVQLYTTVFVTLAIWIAFRWIGLENAGMWGLVAGILKSIPFLGGIVIIGGTALVGYLQFGTITMALLIAGIAILIKSLEGLLITPLMTSKAGQINTVWTFVAILFWGWIWGVWGLLLGIPILMAAKAICDRIEGLKPIGEMLGE
ncbi:MAG: AI-2E family transporter [Nitrospirae bacterium]|nr:AI-2E family transporter [Candidatus Manganitrophaceae bacterium]